MTRPEPAPFQYHVTFAVIPAGFPRKGNVATDLSRIAPRPPKGDHWRLVDTATVQQVDGPVMLYYWERPAPAAHSERQEAD